MAKLITEKSLNNNSFGPNDSPCSRLKEYIYKFYNKTYLV